MKQTEFIFQLFENSINTSKLINMDIFNVYLTCDKTDEFITIPVLERLGVSDFQCSFQCSVQ